MAPDRPALKLLALARSPFLSARERILVADALDAELSELTLSDLEGLCGRRHRDVKWEPKRLEDEALRDEAWLAATGTRAYSFFDPDYPVLLRETARPPFMLYVRGRLPGQDSPALAVVGTRFPTGRGLEAAAHIAAGAGRAGVALVSGLARGIDSAAHRGALSGGGRTFAVLGRGVDSVYPPSNKDLAARMIAAGGGLLSEYPPGTPPSRWTFPERNRIIAGLCRSTVVVEAPAGSGALISADFALEEGRDLFVAKAVLRGPRSAGSDRLYEDGAVAVDTFMDIADDWRQSAFVHDYAARA
jgi:DNA processing protein